MSKMQAPQNSRGRGRPACIDLDAPINIEQEVQKIEEAHLQQNQQPQKRQRRNDDGQGRRGKPI